MDTCNQYELNTFHGWSSRLPRVPSTAHGFELFKEQQAMYDAEAHNVRKMEDISERERKSLDGVQPGDVRRSSISSLERSSMTSMTSEQGVQETAAETTQTEAAAPATSGRRSWWRRSRSVERREVDYSDSEDYAREYNRHSEEMTRQLNTLYYF